ncbi:hypothetical protein Sango_2970000 [Sesamum angolense]|uniref:UBA domain-containing protein n=1 Tax=Sesamum angolense TaxID=2727404 RepID=A0AAE1T4Q7_9LAMI|nr:hypothetical protein Sango_2970000 [Sesamum angolense]
MGMGKLRIGGAWSGVLEVEMDEWTVAMLREEVANRSDCGGPHCINLISAGRVLKDGDGTEKLSRLGIRNNAKILASKVSADQDGKSVKDEFLAEEERSKKLSRLKGLIVDKRPWACAVGEFPLSHSGTKFADHKIWAAATSLASRHADGSLPVEDFNLELENQSGEKVQLGSETDQRAIMMGLMLHANAKALLRRQQYRDALEVLTMGEEAFSLCDPKLIEMVDNVSILQIDMVWCYFMLRDITWLSVAGVRLAKAREGIERAHGKESTRLRILQGGRYPELALHLRMELLEGVVAYHSGQLQKSKDALISAQAKYFQLQVPDEALSLLMSMGYKEREAKRALRMNNLDVGSAVDFLVEEKLKVAQKREENLQRQKEILFEKDLAAEALRRNENDTEKALDDLTNPETNSALQNEVISKKRKRLRKSTASAIENLVSMGFDRASVDSALRTFGSEEEALNYLLGQPNANAVEQANPSAVLPNTHGTDGLGSEDNIGSDPDGSSAGPSTQDDTLERDVEMEDQLTEGLQNADAYSDYDVEVTKEGEAIIEYLAMLSSAENVDKVSSPQ